MFIEHHIKLFFKYLLSMKRLNLLYFNLTFIIILLNKCGLITI